MREPELTAAKTGYRSMRGCTLRNKLLDLLS